jgi:hypothetical protein
MSNYRDPLSHSSSGWWVVLNAVMARNGNMTVDWTGHYLSQSAGQLYTKNRWVKPDGKPPSMSAKSKLQNKGQRSMFSAVGTRLGVSSIVMTEITGPTIPCP